MLLSKRNWRLSDARLACGYSQAELADAVHASRETIGRIETLRATPSVSLALAIARTVDATVEELFSNAELR
ncbi:MAG TPA: helix-turn-helix transcriptional regulator [Gaiellaceae bacterium]|nr:helix-turn-helix transcriptional regulator [Gaiellaceae bacterium]